MVSQNLIGCSAAGAVILATLSFPPTRSLLLNYYNSSLLAALSVYAVMFMLFTAALVLISGREWRHGGAHALLNHNEMELDKGKVNAAIDSYNSNYSQTTRNGDGSHDAKLKQRQQNYMTMVNHFYDLVTDFYEYGWGDCFHFGFRFKGEGFQESLRRTEYYLASRIGLRPEHHVVDVGCGVGGPMRNIARFTGSRITGLNNNAYQIKVGRRHNKDACLDQHCDYVQADFMKVPLPDCSFDHAYAIEATCHSPDKVKCYSEVFRLIKPGGYFGAYEWCVTDKYDPSNPSHVAIREGIEIGNGLPVLAKESEVVDALKKSGFEVLDYFNAQRDAHLNHAQVPWYQTLTGQYTVEGFRMTFLGRTVTHILVSTLETLGIAPKGSTKVSKLLNQTAVDLVEGGRLEIFTPSFFVLARKPLDA